jgi:hypothetical protein
LHGSVTPLKGTAVFSRFILKEKDMKRRDLLKGLATVPALSMFGGALDYDKGKRKGRTGPPGILRIFINGPFALVIEKKQPDKITFFTPFDPEKLHQFYFNGLQGQAKIHDDGKDAKRSYHFQLPVRGLDVYPKKRAYIDQCFRDISFTTDLWKKEEYFVTLELPVPDSIGFIPPAKPIIFKLGKKQGSMPMNNVLEYRMTDPDDVKIITKQGSFAPRPASKLNQEYLDYCKNYKSKENYKEYDQGHREACAKLEEEFKTWDEPEVRAFSFGVGVGEDVSPEQANRHALKFYNDVLLSSFPHVREQQELEQIGGVSYPGTPTRGAMLMPAVWDPSVSPRLVPVTAVMDCQVIGPHATVTGP